MFFCLKNIPYNAKGTSKVHVNLGCFFCTGLNIFVGEKHPKFTRALRMVFLDIVLIFWTKKQSKCTTQYTHTTPHTTKNHTHHVPHTHHTYKTKHHTTHTTPHTHTLTYISYDPLDVIFTSINCVQHRASLKRLK